MAGKMKPKSRVEMRAQEAGAPKAKKATPKPPMKGGTMPPRVMPALAPAQMRGKMASGRGTTRGK